MKKFIVTFQLADGTTTSDYPVDALGFKSAYTAAKLEHVKVAPKGGSPIVIVTCRQLAETVP